MFFTSMPGRSHTGMVPPLSEAEQDLRARLDRHVNVLAGEIGERNVFRPGTLEQAALYIEETFGKYGYTPHRQSYDLERGDLRSLLRGLTMGVSPLHDLTVSNLVVELPGKSKCEELVVVGAHYDSVLGCPGANDNGTGVAALLELARLFRNRNPARSLRFCAFVNEEPPFFHSRLMGSRIHARQAKVEKQRITAMVSLETIGCYSDMPGSQSYPFPLGFFYPRAGNFIGFVGNLRSLALVRRCTAVFRRTCPFPCEGLSAPYWLPGVNWSDHDSFWREGYRAVMVTDTAPYRYPHYHMPTDTPDKVDFTAVARVVSGLEQVILDAAGGEEG